MAVSLSTDEGELDHDKLEQPPELNSIFEDEDLLHDGKGDKGTGQIVSPKGSGQIVSPSESKCVPLKPPPKARNRSITMLRIAAHGPTPKCQGCKEGSYAHSPDCRERFNRLIDYLRTYHQGKTNEARESWRVWDLS